MALLLHERFIDLVYCFITHQGAPWSWKLMEFRKTIFRAWKVMENSKGHGKVMESDDNVMEFLLLH